MATKKELLNEILSLQEHLTKSGWKDPYLDSYYRSEQYARDLLRRRKEIIIERLTFLRTERMRFEFFITPQGAALKKQHDKGIADKISECEEIIRQVSLSIEKRLQHEFGPHWGVVSYRLSFLRFAIIDFENSTPQERRYNFDLHHDTEITYVEKDEDTGKEVFLVNFGKNYSLQNIRTAKCKDDGTLFYHDMSCFFANKKLVGWMRIMMRDANRKLIKIGLEVKEMNEKFNNQILISSNM